MDELVFKIDRLYDIQKETLGILKEMYNSNRKINVIILVEWAYVWNKVYSLYEEMISDKQYNCTIVAINIKDPSVNSDDNYPQFISFLIENGIPFIAEEKFDIEHSDIDVIIYTNPYDHHHEKFDVNYISSKGIKIVYIPYATQFFINNSNSQMFFNLPIHNLAWRIYARSAREKERYRRYCSRGDEHVVIAGQPFTDYMLSHKTNFNKGRYIKFFLWSLNNIPPEEGGTFLDYYNYILEIFTKNDNIALIIRPHPLFVLSVLRLGIITETQLQNFFNKCAAMHNVFFDENPDIAETFCISDALLSEPSSLLIEYLPANKPVLVLVNKNTPSWKKYPIDDSDIINIHYLGNSNKSIYDFIYMVLKGKDYKKKLRNSSVSTYYEYMDKKCGYRIKEDIKNNIL